MTHKKFAVDILGLGSLREKIEERISALEEANVVKRIFEPDPSLWTNDSDGQAEVKRRTGWLESPQKGKLIQKELSKLVYSIQSTGITHALLLGMGGSSLAPEVMASTFGIREDAGSLGLDLSILDSTDPAQVRQAARRSPIAKTLFIIASKSGSTLEVNAAYDYFWGRAKRRLGQKASEHFVVITDPGTVLEKIARERGVRQVIFADSTVGGRFSALTAFGLVPAALIGLDLDRFLEQAQKMASRCQPDIPAGENPGLVLGATLAEAASLGRDKLTILADPELSSFGSWVEQLVAESTGKGGKGIIPIDLEPMPSARHYSNDRFFVYLRLSGAAAPLARRIKEAGHPILEILLTDEYQMAAEFYRWEFATAVACSVMGVNAFDQPDVQDSKLRTQSKITFFEQSHIFNEGIPIWYDQSAKVYGRTDAGIENATDLREVIRQFLDHANAGNFIAINAYFPRDSRTFYLLQKLRAKIQNYTGKATTLGFGPRFLHSTGQYHKGGANKGIFIQLTADTRTDIEIPGWGITFGNLERAQALGDFEALLARDRHAIRIHLVTAKLAELME